jgi:hypothetical protein
MLARSCRSLNLRWVPAVHTEIDTRVNRLRLRLVGEPEPERPVDLHLVSRVGLGPGLGQVAEAVQDGGELFRHQCGRCLVLAWWLMAAAGGGPVALFLRFGDPAGDQARVGAGIEGGPVAGDLLVVLGDQIIMPGDQVSADDLVGAQYPRTCGDLRLLSALWVGHGPGDRREPRIGLAAGRARRQRDASRPDRRGRLAEPALRHRPGRLNDLGGAVGPGGGEALLLAGGTTRSGRDAADDARAGRWRGASVRSPAI